jgi:hypothetical protein
VREDISLEGLFLVPLFRGHHIMQVEKKNTLKNWPAKSLAQIHAQINKN